MPKTLAMIKMEKNFIALEKGYPRHPYNDKNQNIPFLIKRLEEEFIELKKAYRYKGLNEAMWFRNMREELADISNIVDYIFEKVS